ncbi:MAG: hypothetical protein WCJ84_06040 [Candidatus Peregrinibacteria bacterium]
MRNKNFLITILGILCILLSTLPVSAEDTAKSNSSPSCTNAIIHSFSVADYLWGEERKKILENITVSAVAKTTEIAALNRRYKCYGETICWALGKNADSLDALPTDCNLGNTEGTTEPLYKNAKEAFKTLEIQYDSCTPNVLQITATQINVRTQCENFKDRKLEYSTTEVGNDFSQNLSLEVQGVFAGKLLELTKRLATLNEEVGRFVATLNSVVRDANCTISETK